MFTDLFGERTEQFSLSDANRDATRKRLGSEVFLVEMEKAVRWSPLVGVIQLHCRRARKYRYPHMRRKMLRVHLMQQW